MREAAKGDEATMNKVLALVSKIAADISKTRKPVDYKDIYEEAFAHLDDISKALEGYKKQQVQFENNLGDLVKVVSSFAVHEFTANAPISGHSEVFDTIAAGLNMLGEELHETTVSKEYFESLFNSITDLVIVTDAKGKIQFFNWPVLNTLGYSEKELTDMSIANIFGEKEHSELVEKLIMDDYINSVGNYCVCKNNQKIPVLFSGSILRNRAGEILGFVTISKDITERVRAAEELKQSEFKYRTLIETMQEGILYLDNTGKIVFVNSSLSRITGYNTEELLGKDISVLYPSLRTMDSLAGKKRKAGNSGSIYEIQMNKRSGELIWANISTSGIAGPDGNLIGSVEVYTDITNRKISEEQLTYALQEKVTLLQEVHHRVKNNLQVISSLLYLQLNEVEDKTAKAKFMESQNRIESMALIHKELYQSSDFQNIDFGGYIKNLSNHLFQAYNIKDPGISLNVDLDEVPMNIEKAVPCGLIVNELISNSLKHAFPNSNTGMIDVSLKFTDGLYELIVADNGIKLNKDVDIKNSKSLGLKLINILTEQLGGTLTLNRQKGTKFSITFGE